MIWPDMVVVWKNDRNVGDFKLYRHRWLLISTKRPSKRRSGAQPSYFHSKTRVNSLYNADSLFEASMLLISLKIDRNSELTLVFESFKMHLSSFHSLIDYSSAGSIFISKVPRSVYGQLCMIKLFL